MSKKLTLPTRTVRLDEALYRLVKVVAAQQGRWLTACIDEAVREWLDDRGLKARLAQEATNGTV